MYRKHYIPEATLHWGTVAGALCCSCGYSLEIQGADELLRSQQNSGPAVLGPQAPLLQGVQGVSLSVPGTCCHSDNGFADWHLLMAAAVAAAAAINSVDTNA